MTITKEPIVQNQVAITKNKIYIIALFLITLSSFGNNYAFNNPQALTESIKQTLKISQSQFQLFYSVFAFPNILSALFIGYLIDFFEIYRGFVILVFAVAFFQGVVAIGAHMESYRVMLIGRLLFGIASESLITAQAALVSCLFKRKKLALALGVVITFPEIGNAMNSLFTSRFYELFDRNLGAPFFISVVFCTICSLFAMYAVKFIKIINKAQQQNERLQNSLLLSEIMSRQSKQQQSSQPHKQTISMQDFKQLKYSFWILNIICTINLGMYIPFLDGANGLLQTRFKFSEETAGQVIMVTYFSAALLSIPSGLIVDRIGMRRYISIFGTVLLLVVQLILYFSTSQTSTFFILLAFSFLGWGLAIYANCVLASVSLIVKKKIIGTAFGIIQMLESVALCFFPLISGGLVDQQHGSEDGYLNAQFFFIGIGAFGVFCSLGVFIFPKSQKQKLDKGRVKRKTKNIRDLLDSDSLGSISDGFGESSLNKSLISTKSSSSQVQQIQIQNLMNIYLTQKK